MMRVQAWTFICLLLLCLTTGQGQPAAAPNSTVPNGSDSKQTTASKQPTPAASAKSEANAAAPAPSYTTPEERFTVVHVADAPDEDHPSPAPPPPPPHGGLKLNFDSPPLAPQPSQPGHQLTDPTNFRPGLRPTANSMPPSLPPRMQKESARLPNGKESGGLEKCQVCYDDKEPSEFYKRNCNCRQPSDYRICKKCAKELVQSGRRSCPFCRKDNVFPARNHWDWDSDSSAEIVFDSDDSVVSDDQMIGIMQGNEAAASNKQTSSVKKQIKKVMKFLKEDSDSDSDSDVPQSPKRSPKQVRTIKQIMADADRLDDIFGDTSDSDDSVPQPQQPAAAAADSDDSVPQPQQPAAAAAPAQPAGAILKGQEQGRPVAESNLAWPGQKRVVTEAYRRFADHLLRLVYQHKMHLVFEHELREWNQFYNLVTERDFVNYKKHTGGNPGRRLLNLVKSLIAHNAAVHKETSNNHRRMSDQVLLCRKIAREREEARAKKVAAKKRSSSDRTAISEREEVRMGLRPPNENSRGAGLASGALSVQNAKEAAMQLGVRPDAHLQVRRRRGPTRAQREALRLQQEQAAASNAVNGASASRISNSNPVNGVSATRISNSNPVNGVSATRISNSDNGWNKRHLDAIQRTDSLAEELQQERRETDTVLRTMTEFIGRQITYLDRQMNYQTPNQQPQPHQPRPVTQPQPRRAQQVTSRSNRRHELLAQYDDNLQRILRLRSIPNSDSQQSFFNNENVGIMNQLNELKSPTSSDLSAPTAPPTSSYSSEPLVSSASSDSSEPLKIHHPLTAPPPSSEAMALSFPPAPAPTALGYARASPALAAHMRGEPMPPMPYNPNRRVRRRLNGTVDTSFCAEDWDSDGYDEDDDCAESEFDRKDDEPRGPYKSCDR